ncbi:ABC transporter permease [Clostridium sp. YIM B02505]|uniref:ABC transporter permease n=1 Tax=Clostridium yunnanense TaxID=2800325 RepID=A0ABS1EX37_9CLOT|nr:FtsX-like permease family protein [Clostridium yunnanense]MBK1813949.1 ABC transporter permease [Clostridium yunnanense]
MKLSDGFSMAVNDIRKRKIRTVLTVVALSVGSFLMVTMMGVGDSINKGASNLFLSFGDTKQIGVQPEKYDKASSPINVTVNTGTSSTSTTPEKKEDKFKKIDKDALTKMSKLDGVDKLYAYLNSQITAVDIEGNSSIKKKSTNIVGVSFDFDYKTDDNVAYGSELSGKNDDIIVGEKYLSKIGITDYQSVIGKKITLKVEFPKINGVEIKKPYSIDGKIVGIAKGKSDFGNEILTSDYLVNKIQGYYEDKDNYLSEKGYSGVALKAKNEDSVKPITDKVRKDLGYSASNMVEMLDMVNSMTKVVKSILSVAGIIVLLVASLGLINTMTMTIQEKKKSIGVMKAVGASKNQIRYIFIFQCLVLGLLGGLVGCLSSSAAIYGINLYMKSVSSTLTLTLNINNVLIALGVSVVVAFFAGIIPAGRAAKLNVVEILSYE